MPDLTEADLGHQNLISYSRAMIGWSQKGTVLEDAATLCFAGGSWLPVGGNGAFRLSDDVDPAGVVARADAFFGSIGRGYSVKVRLGGRDDDLAAACAEAGIEPFGEPTPHMVCPARLADPSVPDGVVLRPVDSEGGVADFVAVNAEAYATYGMPADVLPDLFDRPGAVVADDAVSMVVAYAGGAPVATALSYFADGVGALQWVGTVAAARKARLGRAVTEWATNAAFDRGASSCSLQASPMGEPLYRSIGYETGFHYQEYVRWKAPGPG